MRIAKHILSVILSVALLSTGLPFFSPEDANRDSSVNLEDVILSVRDFARTADTPEAFTSNVKKVLSTLHIVAGLKTNIKPANDSKSLSSLIPLNVTYLISSNTPFTFSDTYSQVPEDSFHYESIVLLPTSPPPRTV